jgi:phospholipid/cholesterol/gamma-HCH transport system substrate-binding protein
MTRQIRKYAKDFAAVIVLGVIASAVALFILSNQRLRFPWEGTPYKLRAEFSTAQAVTPGQGQTVRVSGVRIGDISKVDLRDGRAIVTMDVDPEYRDMIHTDASALLRPKTGLKDMFVELDPGSARAPQAGKGFTIPVSNTLPDINPDEIFQALDADTRDYLKLLVGGAGRGLAKRGNDLQEVFRRFEPTHRDLARVNGQLAKRHEHLRRLVHSLNLLNGELAGKGDELARLVSSSADVFRAFASEQANVTRAVGDLPGALRQTTQTLGKVQGLAEELKPAAEALRPAARALTPANKAIAPFAKATAPVLRDQVRPFVRGARPLVRKLDAPAGTLAKATPDLTRVFTVLNHLLNMVGYNPGGTEGPAKTNREEGFLFWIAWLDHNGTALFSSADAGGTFRPITAASTCSILHQMVADRPETEFLQGLTAALNNPTICG